MATVSRNTISWGLGALVSIVTIGSLTYWISKDKKEAAAEAAAEAAEEEAAEEVFYPPSETIGSNINHKEALRRATNIYTAMKGPGTDEKAIFRAQRLVNGSGLKRIYNLFGIRESKNMGQWFTSELSDYEIQLPRGQWHLQKVTPPF